MYSYFLRVMQEIRQKNLSVSTFFTEKNLKNIAIYGAGTVGNILFEEIHKEVNVKYFIDKNLQGMAHDVPIVKPEDVKYFENIDAIVISPYIEHTHIESKLSSLTSILTVSIDEIIGSVYKDEIFFKLSERLKNSGAFLYIINRPLSHEVENASALELAHKTFDKSIFSVIPNILKDESAYDLLFNYVRKFHEELGYYSDEYFRDLFVLREPVIANSGGSIKLGDVKSTYFNTINGFRFLPDQLDEFSNTLYIFGDCFARGRLAEDKLHLANQLQVLLKTARASYRVVAPACVISSAYALLEEIEKIPLMPGDIVLHISRYFSRTHFDLFCENFNSRLVSLSESFKRPHDFGEIFFDAWHMSYKGISLMAKYIYELLIVNHGEVILGENKDGRQTGAKEIHNPSININITDDLNKYTVFLSSHKLVTEGRAGSVVVNCNPFTLGHQYLIETASTLVDYLYVFVVEEDLSEFKFADRFEMVKLGTNHLDNVKVLPGGKFIISTFTFPGYFDKSDMPTVAINATKDVEIFAKHIAPVLDITVRFVGSEPLSAVTRQYNRDLRDILPRYGIEYKEFGRIEFSSQPISASLVRQLIKQRDWDSVKNLVPQSTYDYISHNYECLVSL